MFANIDNRDRVVAINENDMSGNTGWVKINNAVEEPITEEHGVPLYKLENNKAVARTTSEINQDISEIEPERSTDPLDEIRYDIEMNAEAIAELGELIGG